MIRQGDASNLEVLFPIKRCLDKCSAGQYTFIYIHYMCIYIHFSLQFVLLISGKSFFMSSRLPAYQRPHCCQVILMFFYFYYYYFFFKSFQNQIMSETVKYYNIILNCWPYSTFSHKYSYVFFSVKCG